MSVHYCVCINYRYKRKSLVQIAEMELMAFKRDGIEKIPTSPSFCQEWHFYSIEKLTKIRKNTSVSSGPKQCK